ncbi:diablo IAP-binding mitochondrial protein-like [Procambarus clarkii]|uniref:diablo IAP-binding mitochondrial protein-like n=1 Tax=Procambarus clarkii TaxID=6728 RepID=UPI0037442B56
MWQTLSRRIFNHLPSCGGAFGGPGAPQSHFYRQSSRMCKRRGESLSHILTKAAECVGRKAGLWVVTGGGVILAGYCLTRRPAAACQAGFTDDTFHREDLGISPVKPLEMNEAAALTHSSLLRQASGVTVDASLQLLHRVLRARLDFSEQYRKQLNDAIDLLEYCTAVIHSPEQHDNIWQHFVISRAEMETLKDQLKDLNMLMTYAYTTLENAAMTAFMSGVEFTASAAQQAIDNARVKMEIDTKQNLALELQYVQRHTRYIEASQKVIDETEKASEDTEQIEDDLKENED